MTKKKDRDYNKSVCEAKKEKRVQHIPWPKKKKTVTIIFFYGHGFFFSGCACNAGSVAKNPALHAHPWRADSQFVWVPLFIIKNNRQKCRRPRVARTPSRVQAAAQSNTTCARSTLCVIRKKHVKWSHHTVWSHNFQNMDVCSHRNIVASHH